MKLRLYNYSGFKNDVHEMKRKMAWEFLSKIDGILQDLGISTRMFEELGDSLHLKNTFDYALFFGAFDSRIEICDNGSKVYQNYELDIELTKDNIVYVFNNYRFIY